MCSSYKLLLHFLRLANLRQVAIGLRGCMPAHA
jgi:hypothetical protein